MDFVQNIGHDHLTMKEFQLFYSQTAIFIDPMFVL